MIPVIGQDNLGLGAVGIGLLASMDGVGAFCGAVAIALFAKPAHFARLYIGGVVAYLLMLPVFALAPDPLLAGTVLLVTGLANAGFSIMQATLVYLAAPPEMRSRIFGVLSVCIGVGMIGFIHLGLLAGLIGASWATVTIGVEGIAAMLLTRRWWRAHRRVSGGGLHGNRRCDPPRPMYLDRVLREKKMSSTSLDLRRAETRGIDYVERARRARADADGRRGRDRGAPPAAGAGRRGADRGRLLPHAAAALAGRRRAPPADLCPGARGDRQGRAHRPPGRSGRIPAARCRRPISTRRWRARSSGRRAASSPGGRNCRAPGAASPSRAASGSPGAGGSRPAAGTPPGSARMSRCSSRTARRA